MLKNSLKALAAIAALAVANPASADVYTYTMTNNDVLTINSATQSATFIGSAINASMTSTAFATFAGGAAPTFTAVLSSLDGTRLINGSWVTDNPYQVDTVHPQKLILSGTGVNLWAFWGNPISGGDYLTTIKGYTQTGGGGTGVPEPGMLGLMAVGLGAVAFGRRRRRAAKAA